MDYFKAWNYNSKFKKVKIKLWGRKHLFYNVRCQNACSKFKNSECINWVPKVRVRNVLYLHIISDVRIYDLS